MRSVSDLGVRRSGVAVAILLQALTGCSDTNGPNTGAIEVTVTTAGAERHPTGYGVSLDGGAGQLVAVNGSLSLTGLKAGDHMVALSDLAPCTLNGPNPRSVVVVAGSTTPVAFVLSCSALSVAGVWDWTEQISPPGGYACSDTGSYAFAQVGLSFTGTSDQVGSCSGFGSVIDNTHSDPLSGGLVYAGDSVRFAVAPCVYRGVISGDPASSISGVVSCDTLNRPQGTWRAHPGGTPATVTVSPDSLRQLVGDSARLTVALRDAAGSRVFRRPITWSSSNPSAATVDGTGMVKAVGAGKASISAGTGGASGTGKVAVELGGIFRITNVTGGSDLDPTGYVLVAGSVLRGGVGVNTTADLPRLFAGTYSVALSDVASNCRVSGDNPRTLAVTEGATTTSTFEVTCVRTTKLALSSHGSIGVIYADGSNLVTIAAGSAPSWSPDESRIAFSCAGGGGAYDICTVSPDGTALVRVTSEQVPGFIDGAWSPDGAHIAAGSRRGGTLELYVMNPDGRGAMPITSNVGYRGRPAWSPDGTKIAFDCQVDPGNDDICVINADGTGFARLTRDPAADGAAAWKPDGSQIAFATSRYGAFEVALMNSDGSGVARINGGTLGLDPAWSRDGAKLAFSREDGGCDPDSGCFDAFDLYVMNADGSGLAPLGGGGDDHEPDWRP